MAYVAEGYYNVHAAPTSGGSAWACQIWFGLTRSETSATTSKVTVHWSAKLTSNAYLGSSGLMFRYKINSGGAWTGWYSLIGNGNYGGWRGSNLFTYSHGWYNNSEPYFTVSAANRSHDITRGATADSAITVYFDFRRSNDMIQYDDPYAEQTLSCTIPKRTYYWDINAYNPDEVQDYKAAYFDEYIGNALVANDVTNESASHNYQPYGTYVYVADIKPYYNYYELDRVANSGGELPLSNGKYGHQITGYSDDIYIYMRYKISTLKLNPNGGMIDGNSSEQTLSPNIQYNSNNGYKLPVPTRIGYKFLGWFTASSGGTQTHNENGDYIIQSGYWEVNGVFKGTSDLTLYAHWEIQNVCYVKQDNTWKLSTVYIKTSTGWQPAIMYIKTDSGWVQSGP